MTKLLFVIAVIATFYLALHIPAAMWLTYNGASTITVRPPAYIIPLVLWIAYGISRRLS